MNARPPSGRAPRVHFRGQRALLLAALALLIPSGEAAFAAVTGVAPLAEKSEEEKLFDAIGGEWKGGDAKGLSARFPAKRKISLRLPDVEAGDYRAEQAKSLLEKYFAGRTFTKVELKSVKEATGTFDIEYTREDRKKVVAQLLLVLGTEEKKRVLVSARETS